ncbi:MAG: DUF1294 domain-containing protein [Alphaproteobacteria bacterium]|nr:DUF1294 domain-containing protein [Alphaproteobacteria bacterium]
MVLTFVAVMLTLLFVLPPLKKNAFYLVYFGGMTALAYVIEMHGVHYHLFSKEVWLTFLACHFVMINLVTFLAYGVDKKAAKTQQRRVPEMQLHLLEFLGGSPGAFVAQKVFHHKTKKKSFQISFVFVLAIQVVIVYYVLKILNVI